MRRFKADSLKQTSEVAKRLSKILTRKDIVGFWGSLGSGKTAFIKSLAERFGVQSREVTSASFVIMKKYQGRIPLYHIDLYRLNSGQIPGEVYEYIEQKPGLVLVEWANRIEMPQEHFQVYIKLVDLNSREIILTASTKKLKRRLQGV